MKTDYLLLMVAAPTVGEAENISRTLVEKRLAACCNIIPGVRSTYRWKGKIISEEESLVVIKTTALRVEALKNEVRRLHSYDIPEVIAVPIVDGLGDYLSWVGESVR